MLNVVMLNVVGPLCVLYICYIYNYIYVLCRGLNLVVLWRMLPTAEVFSQLSFDLIINIEMFVVMIIPF